MRSFLALSCSLAPAGLLSPSAAEDGDIGLRWTESLPLVLDHQVTDGALTNQLARLVLERSDTLYQVPQYEACVHRWVLAACG